MSTNALRLGPGTSHKGVIAVLSGPLTCGTCTCAAWKPTATAAAVPAARPPIRQADKVCAPAAEPAEDSACLEVPGLKAAKFSSNTGLPPDWLCRCTVGFQPPDTATRSQSRRLGFPTHLPPPETNRATSTSFTPSRP